MKRIWIASRGGVSWRGNLNVKLASTDKVFIRYYNGEWLEFNARFGRRYLPLIKELIELAGHKRVECSFWFVGFSRSL